MPDPALRVSEFKKQLRPGLPKMGLFLNAPSPPSPSNSRTADTIGSGSTRTPWLRKLSAMLSGIARQRKSPVRVGGYADRPTSSRPSTCFDGNHPLHHTAAEAREAISCAKYPMVGTRPSTSRSAA
jgi:hypothetical protein